MKFNQNKSAWQKLFLLHFVTFCFGMFSSAQNTITFSYTGGPQTWVVPACISSITVTVAGGKGGGSTGGNGAVVTGTLSVTPGQILQMNVGGAGAGTTPGWNGGGTGQPSGIGFPSFGGGGASDIRLAPYGLNNRLVVAGGGGASGGGPTFGIGGQGGCPNGNNGTTSYGQFGAGGSTTAGGNGGLTWSIMTPSGAPGTLGLGGAGGADVNFGNGPGGGGGGGLFGGGGGGSDNISITSAMGGGGGGGGSSLIPSGGGCSGTNTGNGYITITTGGVAASNTGPYCVGGSIQLNATPGLTYTWVGPNGFTSSTQNPTISNITNVNAGVYGVVVTGTGCSDTAYTTVVINPPITPNAGLDDTVCFGFPFTLNGTITIPTDPRIWSVLTTGITPTPNVSFSPNFVSLTPTVTVTQPGLYHFILRETNPICGIFRDTVKIFVKQMDISSVLTNPSCFGSADGEIELSGQDATEFSFDNGTTWVNDPVGTGFTAGNYTVCVRDNNLCKKCETVTLVNPPNVVVSVSNDTLICQNGTAQLVASAIGGSTFQFHWEHTTSVLDTQAVSPLVDSVFVVYAENEFGCVSTPDSIFVTVRSAIDASITPDTIICPGYPTPLDVTASGGIGAPYNYTWSSGQSGVGVSHSISANPPVTQTFTVTITDACESTPYLISTDVEVAPLPVPAIAVEVDKICEPAIFVIHNETDSAMVDYLYWELSDGQIFVNQEQITTAELWAGLYNVQLIVTSPQGCIDSTTFINALTVHAKPVADFRHSPNPVLMFNTQVQLTNYSSNGASYEWFIQDGNPAYSQLKHVQTKLPDGVTGKYNVQLITTSEFGCKDTSEQIVIVLPEVLIYAPNSFTPDGDEYNQDWGIHIDGIDVYNFELHIFNRWGEVIWESKDPSVKWDGTYKGKLVEQGTYTWIIRAKDAINDGKYEFNGFINVLK